MKKITLLLLAVLLLPGCAFTTPTTCQSLDQITPELKHEIIASADQYLNLIKENKLEEAYQKSSLLLKKEVDEAKFKLTFADIAATRGEIITPEFKDLKLINKPDSDKSTADLTTCPDEQHLTTFKAETPQNRQNQALLFYEHPQGREKNLILIHLVEESDEWKLLHFWIRQNTFATHDADYYLSAAENHSQAGHRRNAYLYYKNALILANFPKLESQHVANIEQKITELEVTDIPKDQPVEWEINGEKFQIAQVTSFADDVLLKLYVVFLVDSLEDNASIQAQGQKIIDYVMQAFPEYPEAFSGIIVEAKTDLASEDSIQIPADFIEVNEEDLKTAEEV